MPQQTPAVGSPEHRLLLACARASLDEEAKRSIQVLLESDLDWGRLLRSARRHRVTLLLAKNLKAVSDASVSGPHQERLREHTREFAARNAYLGQELVRLLRRFEAERVPVIPYKGPLVASLAYGNLGLREFNDLDFLVRPDDVARVSAVLRDEGFETADRYTPEEQEHLQREFKEHCFQSGLVVVEPHWSITARRYPFPIDYDALWARTCHANFLGAKVRVFAPEDWLLILCVTGSKSQWRRLELVCDVAESLRAFPNLDWAAMQRTASASGSERMLRLGLALATGLLQAPVPDETAARLRTDRKVQRLKDAVITNLFSEEVPAESANRRARRFSPLLMAMRERPSHRWAYFWRTLTTPTVDHLRRFPLPDRLRPLYRVLVPLNDYVARPLVHQFRNSRAGRTSPSKTA